MGNYNTYSPTRIYSDSLRRRQNLTISKFRGMDASTSELDVPIGTATDLENLMFDENTGRIVTRYGFETTDSFSGRLKGIWKLKDTMFAIVDYSLYMKGKNDSSWSYVDTWNKENVRDDLDFIQGFVSHDRLYLLCGKYYVYVNDDGTSGRVQDYDAYIPTTSELIMCDELGGTIQALDDDNLLSKRRTNKFVIPTLEGLEKLLEEGYTTIHFTGDSFVESMANYDFHIIDNNLQKVELKLTPAFIGNKPNFTINIKSTTTVIGDLNPSLEKYTIVLDIQKLIDNSLYGVATENNMTFTFYAKSNMDESLDKINHCTIGKVYNNRLFVSGNPDYPNTDWHTSDDNGDFTYFSDLDYCNYGTSSTSILGYNIQNGQLLVFKESSPDEPTIYKRTFELIGAMDYTGTSISGQYEEGYRMTSMNSYGVSAIGRYAIADFNGDTILLTDEGLMIYSSVQNVSDSSMSLSNISHNINPLLKTENLANAVLYSDRKTIYLCCGENTYIGQMASTGEGNELMWFKWTGLNAFGFSNIGGLRFLSANGDNTSLCKFNEDVFDTYKYNLSIGTIYGGDDFISVNAGMTSVLDGGGRIEFNTPIKAKIGNLTRNSDSTYSTTSEDMWKMFTDGMKMTVKYFGTETSVTLRQVSLTDFKYDLIKNDGTKMSGSEYECFIEISSLDKNNIVKVDDNKYGITYNGERVDIVPDSNVSLSGTFEAYKPIKSHFITAPITLGQLNYRKTIYGWSMANDTKYNSAMDVGFIASNSQGDFVSVFGSKGSTKSNEFHKLNFDKFKYTNVHLPRVQNRQKVLTNINSIRFKFDSKDGIRMVLGIFIINYAVNSYDKGVR